jgi:hypothetical protein
MRARMSGSVRGAVEKSIAPTRRRAQPDRSLATTGVRLSNLGRASGCRGDEPLCRLSAERLQEPLHDRMLLWPELIGVALCKPSDDREGRELRFGREPAFDCYQIWIKLRGHADPGLVFSLCASVRTARLAGFDRHAERLRKGGGFGYRQWHL